MDFGLDMKKDLSSEPSEINLQVSCSISDNSAFILKFPRESRKTESGGNNEKRPHVKWVILLRNKVQTLTSTMSPVYLSVIIFVFVRNSGHREVDYRRLH